MTVKYLCGCVVEHDPDNGFTRDSEGFVICSVHGVRRYGWRSFPEWWLAGFTLQEVETYVLYGLKPEWRR